jgi:hypothetical protein
MMTHQQAIEALRNDLLDNKANYSQEQLIIGYNSLQTLIDEYLVLAGA